MPGKKAAVYHFTNESKHRPIVYKKQLNVLLEYASSRGFDDIDIYCDMSLKRFERSEFDRFLSCCERYDALFTKDFYHISKNTMKCMNILKMLREKGVLTYTMENGSFIFEEEPFNEPLRVVTYHSRYGTKNELKAIVPLQNEILCLYAKKKTEWSIADQFFDESEHQNCGEQTNLQLLIENREKYDLLLTHNLNDIHWNTSCFCKVREALKMDIYSLQDGFLKYRMET